MHNASLSTWRAVHSARANRFAGPDDPVVAQTKTEIFSARGTLPRPRTISEDQLRNISFYAFWRLFYWDRAKLHRRQQERFLSVTGAGHPTQAKRTHAQHAAYAKQTLYAYMPCDGLRGVDYLDEVCERQFGQSWPAFLRAFAAETTNKWCPTWIRRNYDFLNKLDDDASSASPSEEEFEW